MSRSELDLELTLEAGLTLVRTPSVRSTILHRIACTRLAPERTCYWIDARNTASTHALYECANSPKTLEGLQVARAFTAYQHHSLVKRVARTADGTTDLLVAPNVADLYRDDDLTAWERDDLLAATLTLLDELGCALACPVLVSGADEASAGLIAEYAENEIECLETREGIRLEGDGVETSGYWHGAGRFWQTTIPYWVDLYGSAADVQSVVEAHDRGLLEVTP